MYAIIMDVPRNKLGLAGEELVDILDIKCDPILSGSLRMQEGFLPAYHMHKGNWITVLLDGSVAKETVFSLLNMSYDLTSSKKKNKKGGIRNTEWIVPANPKYYDIEGAINENPEHTFIWKQSNSIAVGDTVYLYVATPISAIRYKCKAIEVNIPYQYADDNVNMSHVMKLKLLDTYDKEPMGLDKLKAHGVYAVRGPRSIPRSLVHEIEVLYHA